MKSKIFIIIIGLLSLIMVENYIINYNSSREVIETIDVINETEEVDINDIINEMKNKKFNISKITSCYDGYEVIIDINGDIEGVRTKLKGLKDNTIKSYKLDIDKGVVSGNITIQYSFKLN